MTNQRFEIVLEFCIFRFRDYPFLKGILVIIFNLSLLFLPLYFAYSQFSEFSFTFINCIKLFGWFSLAHIILIVIVNVILGLIINKL
jgi:hypothetical protein